MSFSTNKILGLITSVVFIVVFLSMSVTLIPTATTAVHNVSDALAGQSDTIGADASTLAGNVDSWTGYFWVVGIFLLVIFMILGMFGLNNRKRGYRR